MNHQAVVERSPDRIVRIKEACALAGISRPTVYRLMRENKFPRSVALTSRIIGFRESELRRWIAELEVTR